MKFAYFYTAVGAHGDVSGLIFEERAAFARASLRKMGLVPVKVRIDPIRTIFGKVSGDFNDSDLEAFYRYFARVEAKGNQQRASTLADAVNTTSDIRLKSAIAAMSEAIGGKGMKVSEAMEIAGFPARDCKLIANVEKDAPIDKVLFSLADELRRAQNIKRTISKLLVQPKIMFFVAVFLLYGNTVYMSPKVYSLFKNVMTSVELPDYALTYYKACDLFNENLIIGTSLYIGLVAALVMAFRSEWIKSLFEIIKPIRIARLKADYAQLWGAFSLLYSVGVHREEICIGLSSAAATRDAKACFARLAKQVREGKEIDTAVAEARFPLYIVNPIISSHRSSSLVEGAKDLAEKLIVDVEEFADKASGWVEILILLGMAGFVFLFCMLTIIPMMLAVFSAV